MNKKLNFLFCILLCFIIGLSASAHPLSIIKDSSGQYRSVKIDAPFPMDSVKEFIFPHKDFVITKYGAKPGSLKDNINAIAKAMEACHKAGGGRVVIPKGEWLTGPVHFKSNVNLHLSEGAVLRFSGNPDDYLPAVLTTWEGYQCYNYSPLIYAFQCENIAITGSGTLSPVMDTWKQWFARPKAHMDALKQLYGMASTGVAPEYRQMAQGQNHLRPHLIQFNRCKNVLLDGFKIRESPFWTIHMFLCNGGIVRNLDVKAHGHNNDGVDIEMTRNFLVENCTFDQGDDAIVIKAGCGLDAWRLNTPSQNIVIRNCKVAEGHVLLGLGSEVSGGIHNVYMHDCDGQKARQLLLIKTNRRRGGSIHHIYMENIKGGNARNVFEIATDVLYQWRELVPVFEERVTDIHDISLKNITCQSADAVVVVNGDPDKPVHNIEVKKVHVNQLKKYVNLFSNAYNITLDHITYDQLKPGAIPDMKSFSE